MALSGVRSFTLTKDDIIRGALRNIGAISNTQSISADQYNEASDVLNKMVKSWQSKSVFLWCEEWVEKVLTSDVSSFVVEADILSIRKVLLKVDDDDDVRELKMLSNLDYEKISDKTITGEPFKSSVKMGLTHSIYLYPMTDGVYTIRYLAEKKLQDFDTITNNADFPSNWMLALEFGLAFLLSYKYNLPIEEKRNLNSLSERYFLEARNKSDDNQEEERRVEPCF